MGTKLKTASMQNPEHPHNAAYAEPIDAIVLAGTDTNPRRMILGKNKAFLELAGIPLVRRVVQALADAGTIGRIFVVGPGPSLNTALANCSERVYVVEQKGHLLSNTWAGIDAADRQYETESGEVDPNRPMLIISCDLPLISAAAIDDFVARCAAEDERVDRKYAILAGVAEETCLQHYHPANGQEGIVRPYVHFHSVRARLANIYVGRPRLLGNQEFLQTGFSYRKAKDWHNVMKLAWSFFRQNSGWTAAWLTMRYQITLLASRKGGWLYHRLRRNNDHEKVERVLCDVLGGRVRMVVTPYGGLSLDVDDEDDFHVLSRNYDRWKSIDPVPRVPD